MVVIKKEIKIINRLGIHARPAAMIAQTAGEFTCDVKICKDGVEVNAKSIMGVMMLAAEYGSSIALELDGVDEVQAAEAISALFETKFNEEF